ncbi:MAG: sulfate/molybdate ABC transporter ATP-binding protein, partial [Gammaproteobacteria bacterium]
RQRVALARALAVEPRVLLLDEPFGALDAQVRRELRRWLRRLHDELDVTSVFVTHDQEEAMEVADRVVVMNHGRIEQNGAPDEIYDAPASAFVYEFVGHVNALPAIVEDGRIWIGDASFPVPASEARGGLDLATRTGPAGPQHVTAYLRPHEVDLHTDPVTDAIGVAVEDCTIAGPLLRIEARLPESQQVLQLEMSRSDSRWRSVKPGQRWFARPRSLQLFPSRSEGPPA